MREQKKIYATIISMTIMLMIVVFLVYILSPKADKKTHSLIAIGINILLIPFYFHVWNWTETRAYRIFDWLKGLGVTVAIVGGSYLFDVLLGVLAFPELPWYISATKNIGFFVTLFLFPLVLAVISATIRAIVLECIERIFPSQKDCSGKEKKAEL